MTILPTIKLNQFINLKDQYSGIDSPDRCIDKKFFQNYTHPIEYVYNSRGFRDSEWPDDSELDNCIWCFGDSFTAGIGQPYEHIWPQVLSEKLNVRTINISMDGGSNNWIVRKILETLGEVRPKTIIAHWSYVNRREKENVDPDTDDYDRRIWYEADVQSMDDLNNTINCIHHALEACRRTETTLINSFIPDFIDPEYARKFWAELDKLNTKYIRYRAIDWARDRHHYGIKTSTIIVDKLIESKYIR